MTSYSSKSLEFYGAVDFSKRSVEVINLALSKCPGIISGLLVNGHYYKNISNYRKNVLDVLRANKFKVIIDPGTYAVWRKNQQLPFANFLQQLIQNITWTYEDLMNRNLASRVFGIFLPDHHMNPDDTIKLASDSFGILTKKYHIPCDKLIGVCHGILPEIPTNRFTREHVEKHIQGIKKCCHFFLTGLNLTKIGLGACSAFKIKANPLNLFEERAKELHTYAKNLKSDVHIHALGVGDRNLLDKIRNFINSFDTQRYLTCTRVRRLFGEKRTNAAVDYLISLIRIN
jgi:hypothetical protein